MISNCPISLYFCMTAVVLVQSRDQLSAVIIIVYYDIAFWICYRLSCPGMGAEVVISFLKLFEIWSACLPQ